MGPTRDLPALLSRLADSVPKEVLDDIHRCSLKRRTGVSLSQMTSFKPQTWLRNFLDQSKGGGASAEAAAAAATPLIQSAKFLHNELPIRFAHRIAELDNLPHGLSDMPHVLKVRNWYIHSFMDLRRFPEVHTVEDETEFTQLIAKIKGRHNLTLPFMARGIAELKHQLQVTKPWLPVEDFPELHQFLDRFFMSRIGIRMLIGQHVAVHRQLDEALRGHEHGWRSSSMIGLIDTKCSPVEVAHRAIADARLLCERTYGTSPQVQVFGDTSFTFPYVPRHLHTMMLELLKNSLRAVHERFAALPPPGSADGGPVAFTTSARLPSLAVSGGGKGGGGARTPPPIRVVVADGAEDVTIKISDEGGGIKRSGLPRIFTYLYSTAEAPHYDPKPLFDELEKLSLHHSAPGQSQGNSSAGGDGPAPPAKEAGSKPSNQGTANEEPSVFLGTEAGEIRRILGLDEDRDLEEEDVQAYDEEEAEMITDEGSVSSRGVLAGHGYGLPISRQYARYFGGDLQIFSMEGYGTDAYLHLNRLRNVQEPLP